MGGSCKDPFFVVAPRAVFVLLGLVPWLVGWLAGWLAGWLVDWLVGWLVTRWQRVGRKDAPAQRHLRSLGATQAAVQAAGARNQSLDLAIDRSIEGTNADLFKSSVSDFRHFACLDHFSGNLFGDLDQLGK